jgi:dUTP pyrophosphatase
VVYFKKIHPDAKIPEYANKYASGMDISSIEDVIIEPGEFKIVETGIACEIPQGYEIQVRARSGLAAKHGVFILNGVGTIDMDYIGPLKGIMANFSKVPYEIKKGDRIAQLVVSEVYRTEYEETPCNLNPKGDRGTHGFGSTGK